MSEETALKISLPFAGGSGQKGICGAVAGAYMVLGLEPYNTDPISGEALDEVMEKIDDFSEKFRGQYGTIFCHELIGLDVFSEEGLAKFRENNMKEKVCSGFVKETIRILEKTFE